MYHFTPQDYEQAERYFELAARLDTNSARAFAGLSFVHWQRAFFELSPDRAGEHARAFELALQSYSINPKEPPAHWAISEDRRVGKVGVHPCGSRGPPYN